MSPKHLFYPESRFGSFTHVDGTVAFYSRVNTLLTPDSVALDIGCGRGACIDDPVPFRRGLRILKGKCREVVGIDVDEAGAENPFLDRFEKLSGASWPLETESIDLAVSDCVLEHIEKPDEFLSECFRVLKPGGYLCIRTTNKWGYVALASRLIPNRLHARVLGKVQSNRKEEDVFPTLYKCNTKGSLTRALRRVGFDETVVVGFESEPNYMAFSRLFYFFGALYQRVAPGAFRNTLFAFARRPER
jgi:SAM-dependent methyltransferase